jgi:hypothetical protein
VRPAAAVLTPNPLALVSLISGLLAFVLLPFAGGVIAVVTGHLALGQLRRRAESGFGFAVAGLVLGYVNIVLTIGLLVLLTMIGVGLVQELQQHPVW